MADLQCLLVEDQSMFMELLLPVLQDLPGLKVVATASTAHEAITAVQSLLPELLILDLCLPDLPGIQVAEALERQRPDAHLIVLSGQASSFICPPELQSMLHAVVDKTSAFRELRQEIGRLQGLRPQTAGPEGHGGIEADPLAVEDPPLQTPVLTLREQQVLALLAQGCSSRAIAETLGLAETTVATHRRALRNKLGASGSELVRLAVLQNHGG
jgi:DNA-binding NarL/FixJ family response regulator